LYHEGFEFKPAFRLWLAANHAPKVDPDDDAMWRRIHRIPMDCQVPKHLRDPKVKAYLTNPSAAGPAIRQWLLKGCLDWQRDGLAIPAVVQRATEEYRASQNSFADFISVVINHAFAISVSSCVSFPMPKHFAGARESLF